MSERRDFYYFGLIVAVMAAVLGFLVLPGMRAIERDRKECEARGGVQAKAYDGFVCVAPAGSAPPGPAKEETP